MPERVSPKILDLPSLVQTVASLRKAGKVIVQCHGCFDIVHPGHIRYLRFAKEQGDVLVVSITGDACIDKGPTRPHIPEELRAENLAALEFVDYVTIDANPTSCNVLEHVRPDLYVKGREYQSSTSPGFVAEREIVERYGGRVVFSSGEVVFSSTQLIDLIGHEAELQWHRLRAICRRHDLDAESSERLLGRMAGKRVVVVGDVVLDRYVLCDAIDVASESPMMSLAKLDEQCYVGGAAIVARHVAALGGVPLIVSAIGRDDVSEHVKQTFVEEDIDGMLLDCRQTIVQKTRYLVEESKLFKVEEGKAEPLDSVSLRRAAQAIIDQGLRADAVIFCDFGYGMISGALLKLVMGELRRGQAIITGDVSGHRADLVAMENVDLLCPTERELRASIHDFDSGLSHVAYNVMQKTQTRHLCVTLGKDGLVLFDRPSQDRASRQWAGRLRSEHLPSLAHRTTDRLGCGDALLAAISLGLAAGGSLTQAAYLANGASALELASLGNVPITHEALRRWLKTRTELTGAPRLEFNLVPTL
ncbi:MAG: adenylyltransferase/cytidyltransferase family protein [Phycisphaerae bacterium]|nr:adenylyltransferase/cytidyltransferase family protein [Phycisphaerae bacterium]